MLERITFYITFHQKRNEDIVFLAFVVFFVFSGYAILKAEFMFKPYKVRNFELSRSNNFKIQRRSLECAKYLCWNILQKNPSIMNVRTGPSCTFEFIQISTAIHLSIFLKIIKEVI